MQIQSAPVPSASLAEDTHAAFLVLLKGQLLGAKAHVVSFKAENLTLRLDTLPRPILRRNGKRVACDLDVAYRVLNADGSAGPWRGGIASDISLSGMCLHIPPCNQSPQRVELKFLLKYRHDSWFDSTEASAESSDESLDWFFQEPERKPLRVLARVCNCRSTPKGYALGLTFLQLSPALGLRLASFTGKSTSLY